MYLFGLKRVKPLAAARLGGMRFLRIRRREAKPAGSEINYLRHASAMSAAIAKNMTTIMSQPSELVHGSSKSDQSSFLDAHYHYSFIVVVALMSLFLVVTISATGLLLAFCRKKNTVFVAASKPEADSQFELDDIENSDIEMCRGDKGECYIHLSDNYDDDDDDDEDDYDDDHHEKDKEVEDKKSNKSRRAKEDDNAAAQRSVLFPRFYEVLKRCASGQESKTRIDLTGNDCLARAFQIPLITSAKTPPQDGVCCSESVRDRKLRKIPQADKQQAHPRNSYHQGVDINHGHVICQNHSHRHHYYHFNFPHHHQRQVKPNRSARMHVLCLSRGHVPYYAAGRLQRSHTIHAIPLTERKTPSRMTETSNQNSTMKFQVLNLDTARTRVSGVSPRAQEITDVSEIDIFVDEDDDVGSKTKSPFDNLKLCLEVDREKGNDIDADNPEVKQAEVVVHTSAGQITSGQKDGTCFHDSKTMEMVPVSEDKPMVQGSDICSKHSSSSGLGSRCETSESSDNQKTCRISTVPLGSPGTSDVTGVASVAYASSLDPALTTESQLSRQSGSFQPLSLSTESSLDVPVLTNGSPLTALRTSHEPNRLALRTPSLSVMHIPPPPKSFRRHQRDTTSKSGQAATHQEHIFSPNNASKNNLQSETATDSLTGFRCVDCSETTQSSEKCVNSENNDTHCAISENSNSQHEIDNHGLQANESTDSFRKNSKHRGHTAVQGSQDKGENHTTNTKTDDIYEDDDDQTIALLK